MCTMYSSPSLLVYHVMSHTCTMYSSPSLLVYHVMSGHPPGFHTLTGGRGGGISVPPRPEHVKNLSVCLALHTCCTPPPLYGTLPEDIFLLLCCNHDVILSHCSCKCKWAELTTFSHWHSRKFVHCTYMAVLDRNTARALKNGRLE